MRSFTKQIVKVILTLSSILIFFGVGVLASEENADILQIYVDGQELFIFENGGFVQDEPSCTISKQTATVVEYGFLSEANITIKTTVLVDTSLSIPSETRNVILDTLKSLVEKKAVNEEYRIISFGEKMSVLQEFTADRYDIDRAVSGITFVGSESTIYDTLYNTMPTLTAEDGCPVFYRTILFTDGADDSPTGITKEELYLRLQNERYPIDVIAVSRAEGAEQKDLGAIVRMSGGRYFALAENSDAAVLAQSLNVNDYGYIRVTIPSVLLDGSIRQVDISAGARNISIDTKIPAIEDPNIPAEPSIGPELTTEPASDTEAEPVSSVEPETKEDGAESALTDSSAPDTTAEPIPSSEPLPSFEQMTQMPAVGLETKLVTLVILCIVLIVLIIAGTVTIILVKRKKQATPTATETSDEKKWTGVSPEPGLTVPELNNSTPSHIIKLSQLNAADRSWEFSLPDDRIIGCKDDCSIQLKDKEKHVSREHCMIAVRDNKVVLIHLSKTNKTLLNGCPVTDSHPLHAGDTIRISQFSLMIDDIQLIGDSSGTSPHGRNDGYTQSIFRW